MRDPSQTPHKRIPRRRRRPTSLAASFACPRAARRGCRRCTGARRRCGSDRRDCPATSGYRETEHIKRTTTRLDRRPEDAMLLTRKPMWRPPPGALPEEVLRRVRADDRPARSQALRSSPVPARSPRMPYGAIQPARRRTRRDAEDRGAPHRLLTARRLRDRRAHGTAWVRQEPCSIRRSTSARIAPRALRSLSRPRRASTQDADEARRRQVAEDELGTGDQRGRRQDLAIRRSRAPTRCSGRQQQAEQRAELPVPQVRVAARTWITRPASAIRRRSPA